jgi:DNA-binding NarL/FixJ family response regulator
MASRIRDCQVAVFDDDGGGLFSDGPDTPRGVFLIEELVRAALGGRQAAVPSRLGADGLSSRELEVLRLIAAGKSNPQIAEELVISLNTVQRHVSNILAKTGLANRTEAASFATRNGLT